MEKTEARVRRMARGPRTTPPHPPVGIRVDAPTHVTWRLLPPVCSLGPQVLQLACAMEIRGSLSLNPHLEAILSFGGRG